MRARKNGFTLIELLVAIALLSVIVVAVTNLFTHSTTAWDSGTRRVQSMMVGRALTDYFVRETSLALCDPGIPGRPGGGGFDVLKGVKPIEMNTYDLGNLFGDTASLIASGPNAYYPDASLYPRYAIFEVVVTTTDKGRTEDRIHTGRAFLWNRNRYAFD